VQMARDHFQPGEQFIFLYGDDLYSPKNIALAIEHDGLSVMGQKVEDPEKWGIFQADADGNLVQVVEKPAEFVGDLANIGIMKLDTRVFDLFDQLKISSRGEYELTDTLQLLAQTEKIRVFATVDYWIPIGYPWHILEAAEYFLPKIESKIEGEVEDGVTIKGKLILPKSSKVLSGTYILGNVMVGENVSIGPDAFLRKNVVIGDNSRISFSSQIKNAVIGHETKIANHTNIGDSVLGNNVNFSSHSSTANWRHDNESVKTPVKGQMVTTGRRKFGAVIGDNVRLGVGTIIYPGRKIWPNQTTKPGDIVDKDLDKETSADAKIE
jgi:UDP-N-acetylglucosamine diphosphorylase / glucose-1-phosphate thymidylyltransferase / UDP-N-acetylgalactosamine diphosphorylase / glucosamine-1-phosphate N-acetyltransferase / galactosamine-1-phosphate N-acetyltransferase